MKQLFAPWRHAWVTSGPARGEDEEAGEGGSASACLFCRVWQNPSEDSANLVVFRATLGLVMLNRYPYNAGHLLIAPREHRGALEDLSPASRFDMVELASRCLAVLGEMYRPDGFNLGVNQGRAAGAGIPEHIHMHVVPRWNGDTNFMSAVGEVRVISQELERIRAELAAKF